MISVCMITFQGEKFLREQLESILSQLAATDEVIIADDGSTDATISLIQNFSDARIHLIQCESHLGPIYNLERALLQARVARFHSRSAQCLFLHARKKWKLEMRNNDF